MLRAGAGSTRVANELGSGRPLRAERAALTVIAIETLLMLGIVAVGIGLRDVWGYLFTDDPEVDLLLVLPFKASPLDHFNRARIEEGMLLMVLSTWHLLQLYCKDYVCHEGSVT